MKTLFLTPSTKINAILVIDKKNPNAISFQHLNMTLLEWTMHFSMSNQALTFRLPNLLQYELNYKLDSSNEITKMSGYSYEDENYTIFVSVIENNLTEQYEDLPF